jgi:hypothetical protein
MSVNSTRFLIAVGRRVNMSFMPDSALQLER